MPARTNTTPSAYDWGQLRTIAGITLAGVSVFLLIRLFSGSLALLGPVPLAMIPASVGAVLAWRQRYFHVAANLVLIAGLVAVGFSHTRDGLIHSPSLWVVCVIPITAGYLLGAIAMLGHTLLAGVIITLAWQGPLLGLAYPTQVQPGYVDWVILRLVAVLVTGIVGVRIVKDTEEGIVELAHKRTMATASRQVAQAFDTEKSRFLTQMVHEIRTPMNGIKGIVQHWSRRSLAPQVRESVEVMDRCADHLMAMMSDIQDLSNIDMGQVETLKQPFLVNQAIRDVLLIFEAKAQSKSLSLEVSGPTEDRWVVGDGQRLIQVISNLVANAIKFSDQGTVSIEWGIDQGGKAHFTVADQGIGMSPAQVESLFQKYAQVHLDEGVSRGGTGLGLTISKALSEAMGGQLTVKSLQGEWTRFRLELPLPDAQKNSPRVRRGTPVGGTAAGMQVMVVDDDAVSLMVQRLALEQMGCTVHCGRCAREALVLVETHLFDLILMDLRMPGLDGIETTRCIRELSNANATTPIVALTASSSPEDRRRCLESGMLDVLVKPFAFETLGRVVQSCRGARDRSERAA